MCSFFSSSLVQLLFTTHAHTAENPLGKSRKTLQLTGTPGECLFIELYKKKKKYS